MARDYSDIAQKGAKGHSKPEVISNPEESKPKQRLDENGRNTSFLVPQNEYSKIEHVIAVHWRIRGIVSALWMRILPGPPSRKCMA